MKLQDQVITLEQAKRLKELGITQDSIWFWAYPVKEKMISTRKGIIHNTTCEDILRDNDGDEFDHDVAAAFTVAELGVMLDYCNVDKSIIKAHKGEFYIPSNDPGNVTYFKTEAEARAAKVINALEQEWITPDEVNARLCA